MLLQPDPLLFDSMVCELADRGHPEHYTTNMPEQEYIGRFYGTFEEWTHIDCRFNFEVRGWWPFSSVQEAADAAETVGDAEKYRVPLDFGEQHEAIRQDGRLGHPGAVALHFSGT